jgi:hypothetical protein
MREIIGLMSNPREEKKQSRNDSLQSKLNVGQSRVIIRSDKIIAIRDNSLLKQININDGNIVFYQ